MEELARNLPPTELNNGAIAYWKAGHVQEAMELLQIALSNLYQAFDPIVLDNSDAQRKLACHDPNNDDNKPPTTATTSDDNAQYASPSSSSLVPGSTSTSSTISPYTCIPAWARQESSFLALYDRAFLIDYQSQKVDQSLLLAVVLYNMGLLHHARGLECGRAVFLQSAQKLYQLALSIVNQHDGGATLHITSLLLLALYNNIAYIDSYLCRVDDMKRHLHEMAHVLRAADELNAINDNVNEDDDNDYMVFYMNAMFGEEHGFAVAPAA